MPQPTLTPVDYDPFALGPNNAPPEGVKFTPVDGDPFARSSGTLGKIEAGADRVVGATQAFGEGVGGGVAAGFGKLNRYLGMGVAGLGVLGDAIHSHFSGQPETGMQDYAFSHFVEPSDQMVEHAEGYTKNAVHPTASALGGTAGEMGSEVAQMVFTDGTLTPELAAASVPGAVPVGRLFEEASSSPVKAAMDQFGEGMRRSTGFSALPASTEGERTAEDTYDETGNAVQAATAGLTQAGLTTLSDAFPVSVDGKLLQRIATGAASGAVFGEASRQTMNAVGTDAQRQPFSWGGLAENALFSAAMGAAFHGPAEENPALVAQRYNALRSKADQGDAHATVANDLVGDLTAVDGLSHAALDAAELGAKAGQAAADAPHDELVTNSDRYRQIYQAARPDMDPQAAEQYARTTYSAEVATNSAWTAYTAAKKSRTGELVQAQLASEIKQTLGAARQVVPTAEMNKLARWAFTKPRGTLAVRDALRQTVEDHKVPDYVEAEQGDNFYPDGALTEAAFLRDRRPEMISMTYPDTPPVAKALGQANVVPYRLNDGTLAVLGHPDSVDAVNEQLMQQGVLPAEKAHANPEAEVHPAGQAQELGSTGGLEEGHDAAAGAVAEGGQPAEADRLDQGQAEVASVPDAAFNGDVANGLERIFYSDDFDAQGGSVPLHNSGFLPDEIAALEKAGLATDGHMDYRQFGAYQAERDLRLNGGRKRGHVSTAERAQPVVDQLVERGVVAPVNREGTITVHPEAGEEAAQHALDVAAADTYLEPTEAQAQAGNYRKGGVLFKSPKGDLKVRIETPDGAVRKGDWGSRKIRGAHYGYIPGTRAADGQPVDVLVTRHAHDDSRPVAVINQHGKDGLHDEIKVVLGAKTRAEAQELYLKQYPPGMANELLPKGKRNIVMMPREKFMRYLKSGETDVPPHPVSGLPMASLRRAARVPEEVQGRAGRDRQARQGQEPASAGEQQHARVAGAPQRQAPAYQGLKLSSNAPVYQHGAGAKPVSAIGVHYSPKAGLTYLDPRMAGTGSAGGERLRHGASLGNGDPLTSMMHFYVRTGEHLPPKERVVTGNHAYEARLNNLYDVKADPEGILADLEAKGYGANRDMALEEIHDAGYDGWIGPSLPGMPEGHVASVFGDAKVPVKAAGKAEEPRAMFAGRQAKQASLADLVTAKALEKQGVAADAILKQTGWAKGRDGRWRFELSDRNAHLTTAGEHDLTQPGVYHLGDVLDHPALYRAYPELRSMPVHVDPSIKGAGYHPTEDAIYIHQPFTGVLGEDGQPKLADLSLNLHAREMISQLLHEAQHAVQSREGFDNGAAASATDYNTRSGEVEARNVQGRRRLTDEQRRQFTPEYTEDVPRERQTLRSEGLSAAAAEGLQHGGGVRGSGGRLSPAHRAGVRPVEGLPATVRVDGEKVTFGPNPRAVKAAADYAKSAGLPYTRLADYAKVDEKRARRIADAYEAMKHDPGNPEVKAAYDAMIRETQAQWEAIKKTGLKVDFIQPGQPDPYASNPRKAIMDVNDNNHLWVFPTDAGFGSDASVDVHDNPLLALTGESINGHALRANDVFRIVHDYFGHIKEGFGFRAEGEENAWRSHATMYSPLARRAMTTETRGQNSWVNYGRYGEQNRTASGADTHYADQKIGLLPDWVIHEGAPDSDGIRAALNRNPTLYSGMEKALEAAKNAPKKASPAVWKGWLDGAQRRGEIKQGERDWIGIDRWLGNHDHAVSREEVLDYIRQNAPKIEVKRLGEVSEADIDTFLNDEAGADYSRDEARDYLSQSEEATRYDNYKLPGGENYQEHLLTLPSGAGEDVFRSNHWHEKNVLVHVRMDDRSVRASDATSVISKHSDYEAAVRKVVDAEVGRSPGSGLAARRMTRADVTKAFKDGVISQVEANNILWREFGGPHPDTGSSMLKVKHIHEVQSDWHQAGRRFGYKGAEDEAARAKVEAAKQARIEAMAAWKEAERTFPQDKARIAETEAAFDKADQAWRAAVKEQVHGEGEARAHWDSLMAEMRAQARELAGQRMRDANPGMSDHDAQVWANSVGGLGDRQVAELVGRVPEYDAAAEALQAEIDAHEARQKRPPDAPFKQTKEWSMLGIKHAVLEAIRDGSDAIEWDSGATNADRYSLRKVVDEIAYDPELNGGTLIGHDKNGRSVIDRSDVKPEQLADWIGKEAAEKLLATEPVEGTHQLKGAALDVGGHGMTAFYDKLLVNEVNQWAKRFGGKVEQATTPAPDGKYIAGRKAPSATVHRLMITPAMREAASEGLPMFHLQRSEAAHEEAQQEAGAKFGGRAVQAQADQAHPQNATAAAQAGQVSHAALVRHVDGFMAHLKGRAGHEVHRTPDDLPADHPVRRWFRAIGAPDDLAGTYYNGRMYLFSDAVRSKAEAERVTLHEMVGHGGMRAVFGDDFEGFLSDALPAMRDTPLFKEVEATYRAQMPNISDEALADEYMAALAEDANNPAYAPVWRRLLASTRNWLRSHGFSKLQWTEDDLKALVRTTYRGIRDGRISLAGLEPPTVTFDDQHHMSTSTYLGPKGSRGYVDHFADGSRELRINGLDAAGLRRVERDGQDYLDVAGSLDFTEPTELVHLTRFAGEEGLDGVLLDKVAIDPAALVASRIPHADLGDAWRLPASQGMASPMASLRNRATGTAEQERILKKTIAHDQYNMSWGDRMQQWMRDFRDRIVSGDTALSMKQGYVDALASIARYERRLNGGQLLDAAESAYKATWMAKNTEQIAAGVMKLGVPRYNNGSFEPVAGRKGLMEVFAPLYQTTDGKSLDMLWEGYAYARRANELIQQSNRDGTPREKLLDQAEIDELLKLEQQYPVFKQVLDEYQQFNHQLLDLAVDRGALSREMADLWMQNTYVPFYRAYDDHTENTGFISGNHGVQGKRVTSARLHGSDLASQPIIENIVKNTGAILDKVYANEAMRRVVALTNGVGMERVKFPFSPVNLSLGEIEKTLAKIGLHVGGKSAATGRYIHYVPAAQMDQLVSFIRMAKPIGHDIVSVMENGKPIYYKVTDPMLLRSVTAFTDIHQFDAVLGAILGVPAKLLRQGVVLDPRFMFRNLFRDTVTSWVQSGMNPNVFKDLAKNAKEVYTDGNFINALRVAGYNGNEYYRINEMREHLTEMHGGQNVTVLNSPAKLYRAYHKIGFISEQLNRMAVAKAALDRGYSMAEAAWQAQNTLNFQMRGDSRAMQLLIRAVPFLNARIQGLNRLYDGMRGRAEPDEARRAVIAFLYKSAALAVAGLALDAWNWDDPRYDRIPEASKDTYYHFFIGNQHYMLPKPFEMGSLTGTLPERVLRVIAGKDNKRTFADAMKRMATNTFQFTAIPQTVQPLLEDWANKDSFTGAPIVNQSESDQLPQGQYSARTSPTFKLLAQHVPGFAPDALRSPDRMEHLYRGYTGAIGVYLMMMADATLRATGVAPAAPASRWGHQAVGAIMGTVGLGDADTDPRTKYLQQYYDAQDMADQAAATVRKLVKEGHYADAQEILKDNRTPLAYRDELKTVGKQMKLLRAAEIAIYQSTALSPEEKRARLTRIQQTRVKLLDRVGPMLELVTDFH